MKKLQDLGIRAKVIIGFGTLIIWLVLMNGFSLSNMRKISNVAPNMHKGTFTDELTAVTLEKNFYQMDRSIKSMILEAGGNISDHESSLESARKEVVDCIGHLEKQGKDVSDLKGVLSNLNDSYTKLTNLISQEKKAEATKELNEVFIPTIEKGIVETGELVDQIHQNTDGILKTEVKRTNRIIIIQDVFFVIILVTSIITSAFMSRDIIHPVKELENQMSEIAKGNFNVTLTNESGDEIGQLSRQISGMVEGIRGYISDIQYTLGEISQNNISVEVTREYIGDYKAIKDSMNLILDSLNMVLNEINRCSKRVNEGAVNLSQNAQRMSEGAKKQSEAVEEFKQYLVRVAELTEEDAENAGEIKKVSIRAMEAVEESNNKMQEMSNAMITIEDSSKEIAKVIKMIEDIAFQTNILALNAAVEASRAGTAGKGFAVVADEVRDLASKSSESAKNITKIIQGSVNGIHKGLKISEDTANSIGEVSKIVDEMSVSLEHIDASTSEQIEAFEKMKDSVRHISEIVDYNRNATEENIVSSEELAMQSKVLDTIISKFQMK